MSGGAADAYRLQPRVQVEGVDPAGRVVARLPLGHGQDPALLLAGHGYAVRGVRGAGRDPGPSHLLTFTFDVVVAAEDTRAAADTGARQSGGLAPQWDQGLVPEPGEVPRAVQRVAAYAVVTSARGVLLTEFSDRTNAPGQWGLPGGGLDPDETPDAAVVREIWEETGQRVTGVRLVRLQSSHWVGRAPTGVLEDFHALRVIYTATCTEPSGPVVHDVGGTTSDAAWVPAGAVADLPLTATWRELLVDLLDVWAQPESG